MWRLFLFIFLMLMSLAIFVGSSFIIYDKNPIADILLKWLAAVIALVAGYVVSKPD